MLSECMYTYFFIGYIYLHVVCLENLFIPLNFIFSFQGIPTNLLILPDSKFPDTINAYGKTHFVNRSIVFSYPPGNICITRKSFIIYSGCEMFLKSVKLNRFQLIFMTCINRHVNV